MITDPTPHLFWITSRAAGTTALLLSSASVSMGLMMAGKLRRKAGTGAAVDRRIYHEILSLSTMVAIAVHGLSLLGDSYLRPSVLDIAVPFVSGYETIWTSIGIITGWGLVFLGLGYYARERIGRSRFKLLHRFTLLFWVAGIVHTLGEGTDAGQPWFLALLAVTTVPPLVLLAARLRTGPRSRPSRPPRDLRSAELSKLTGSSRRIAS